MKRSVSIILVLLLMLAMLPAALAEDVQPGWKDDTSPITFTWFVGVNWWNTGWDTANAQYITDKTGVSIEYITPMDPNQELTLMMATENLPDIISLGFWEPSFDALWQGDFVYALNELADEYDPYFYQVAGDATLVWYKQADGNSYCIPNEAYSEDQMATVGATNANQTFLVRKDIYEEMGSPEMRTPEGFLSTMRKLQEEYTEYKGQYITPMYVQSAPGYGFMEYLQSLLAVPYVNEDGTLYDRSIDPTYIKWLKTFREAFAEGLITEDVLIGDTSGSEKINNGAYFCMMAEYPGVTSANTLLYNNDPDSVYIAIDGPANDNLDKPNAFPGSMSGWMPVFISKNCANPERAIKFITYLASEEGQMDVFLGQEGVTWDYVDGNPTFHEDVIELMNTDVDSFNQLGIMDIYWQMRNPVLVYPWRPLQPSYIQDMIDWSNANCDYSAGIFKNLDPSGNDDAAVAWTKISADWEQTLSALITAPTEADFDAEWDAFLARRDEMGYDLVKDFRQATYEERLSKLN